MRTKSTQEAKTAKKAMFMIERCLSVGDTGSSRSGGEGGYSLIFALRPCAAPKRYGFLAVLVFVAAVNVFVVSIPNE